MLRDFTNLQSVIVRSKSLGTHAKEALEKTISTHKIDIDLSREEQTGILLLSRLGIELAPRYKSSAIESTFIGAPAGKMLIKE